MLMFQLVKFFLTLPLIAVAAIAVFYFLPAHTKELTFETLTGIVPKSIEAKARELLRTPVEKRAKLLSDLETELNGIQGELGTTSATSLQESRTLVRELAERNTEQSLTELLKDKLADRALNAVFGTTTQCVPQ